MNSSGLEHDPALLKSQTALSVNNSQPGSLDALHPQSMCVAAHHDMSIEELLEKLNL
jgi:hypothetical protein